jgi:hypothetical protein
VRTRRTAAAASPSDGSHATWPAVRASDPYTGRVRKTPYGGLGEAGERAGCDAAQGDEVAQPMALEEFLTWLRDRPADGTSGSDLPAGLVDATH